MATKRSIPRTDETDWNFEDWGFEESGAGMLLPGTGETLSAAFQQVEHLAGSLAMDNTSGTALLSNSKVDKTSVMTAAVFSAARRTNRDDEWGKKIPSPIDSRILAMMRVSELFEILEGDVKQGIMAPLQIGLSEVGVECKDRTIRDECEELIENIKMRDAIHDSWHTTEVFGNYFILPVTSRAGVDFLLELNPKCVGLGSLMSRGGREMSYILPDDELGDLERRDFFEKSKEQMEQPDLFYRHMSSDWNEQVVESGSILLPGDEVIQVTTPKHRFQKWGIPTPMLASRSITTRMVHEEMVRGIIDGVKGQFWLVTLANPRPGEIPALRQHLQSNRADRVGTLFWRDGIEIEAFVPGKVDDLLAPDVYWRLTLDIFRKMGISVRLVSGESPSQGGRSTDAELDIKVMVERLRYHRRRSSEMGTQILQIHGETKSKTAAKEWKEARPKVKLDDITPELESKIRDRLSPIFDRGAMTVETLHEMVGINHEQETERMEKEDKELWAVRPTFAQESVTPGGAKTTSSPRSPGGPQDTVQPTQKTAIAAAVAGEGSSYRDYELELMTRWERFRMEVGREEGLDERRTIALAFLGAMAHINEQQRFRVYQEAYLRNGSWGEPDMERAAQIAIFDAQNFRNYQADILDAAVAGQPMDPYTYRTRQYALNGFKNSFMGGLFQAKEEQGWTGWRREVRPWGSKSGPCATCLADAKNIHPITEPFWEPHPDGACSAQFIQFYLEHGEIGTPVRVPWYGEIDEGRISTAR